MKRLAILTITVSIITATVHIYTHQYYDAFCTLFIAGVIFSIYFYSAKLISHKKKADNHD